MGIQAMLKSLYLSYAGGTLGSRVARAAGVCPQNVWQDIFTVNTGNVLMTMLVGERTIIQAGGASNLDMQIDPTAGAAIALCAVTVVTADAVGTFYTFTGNPADACYAGLAVPGGMAGGALATGQNMHGWIVPPGTIEWRESAAAGTGSIQWYMFYVPIDTGATVTAA